MSIYKINSGHKHFPPLLKEIYSAPKQIYLTGRLETGIPLVAIVGSRKHSRYGEEVTTRLSQDLASAGVGIVSGLALGLDAIAHRAAIDAGGYTLAIMACGLDRLYPATNRSLGIRIIKSGGGIISEFEAGMPPLKHHFPARNRLVAGICHGVVVTEARERSGSLITASFALEQNRQVMAVPGNITSSLSKGTNNLIKAGATPVTSAQDVLDAIGLATQTSIVKPVTPLSKEESEILDLLDRGVSDGEEMIVMLDWDTAKFNQVMTLMEISGKIKNTGDGKWIKHE